MVSPEKIKIEKIQELINEGGINAPEKIDKAFEEIFKWLSQYKLDLDSDYESVFENWKKLKNGRILLEKRAKEESIKSSLKYFLQQIQEKQENSKTSQIDWKKIIATVLGFVFMGILGWIFTDFPSFSSFFTPKAKPQLTYTLLFEAEENPPIEWKATVPMIKITTDQTQEEIIVDHRVSFTAEDTLKDWVYLDLLGEPNYLIREDSIKLKPGNNRVMVYRVKNDVPKPRNSFEHKKDPQDEENSGEGSSEKVSTILLGVYCPNVHQVHIDGNPVSSERKGIGKIWVKVPIGQRRTLEAYNADGNPIFKKEEFDVEKGGDMNYDCAVGGFIKL